MDIALNDRGVDTHLAALRGALPLFVGSALPLSCCENRAISRILPVRLIYINVHPSDEPQVTHQTRAAHSKLLSLRGA
jgi:hypothetical protein